MVSVCGEQEEQGALQAKLQWKKSESQAKLAEALKEWLDWNK